MVVVVVVKVLVVVLVLVVKRKYLKHSVFWVEASFYQLIFKRQFQIIFACFKMCMISKM
jgi:hypothetical protein